jgi:nitroreductase
VPTDFLTLAQRQRACRQFLSDPIPDRDLDQMIEVATHAPSAENAQPWVFVVVQDPEVRARIGELARQVWHGGGRDYALDKIDARILHDVDGFIDAGFGGAPVLVVLGVDTARIADIFADASVYPAAQNLLLAANALGYGSAITNFTVIIPDALRAVVGFPDTVRPLGVITLGRPATPLGAPRREAVASKTHRDRYGSPWHTDLGATADGDPAPSGAVR